MGWQFDGVNDNVTVADNAGLTLPDGDWTIACWMKPDTTGSVLMHVFQWGSAGASPSWRILASQASHALPSGMRFDVEDSGGDAVTAQSASLLSDDTWVHVSLERSGSTFTLYLDGSSVLTDTDAAVDGVNVAASLFIGSDGLPSNYFKGTMAEFAIWSDVNSSRRTALAGGASYDDYTTNRQQYVSMRSGYVEEDQSATVTNNGTVEDVTDHPPAVLNTYTATVNETSVFGGSSTATSAWSAIVNEVSIFGGTGPLASSYSAVVNETSIFDGSGTLETTTDYTASVNESSVYGGSGTVNADISSIVNELSVFAGSGTIIADIIGTVNEVSVFDGTGIAGAGYSAIVNEVSVFDGSGVITSLWVDADTATSLSWSDSDTATNPTWEDSV